VDHFFQDIPGWFDFDDIYADAVREAVDGSVLVEVGSWLGRSSAFMAVEIKNSGKRIGFHCVDTWKGSPTEQYHQNEVEQSGGSIRSRFVSNMRGLPVVPIESDSALAAERFEDESVDFVFIDASHEYDAVSRDIAAWYPKVQCPRDGADAERQEAAPHPRRFFLRGLSRSVRTGSPSRPPRCP